VLDLRDGITACLFDLDGVLTQTAKVHAKAWKQMFDEYLRDRAARTGEPFREFTVSGDYEKYVDGKPRRDGIRSFLASREIDLPLGTPDGSPDDQTIYGLGLRKNDLVTALIHNDGVEPYEGSVRFVDGVVAGRGAHFGQVIGVDRTGHAEALREHGADVVVQDLAELLQRKHS
jgi:beta-phosphoglucomutase-like phosphatase (HAD superfamily)